MRPTYLLSCILCILAFSSIASANSYIKPELKLSSFFDENELRLEQIQQLPPSSWEILDDNIHDSKFFETSFLTASKNTFLWLKVELPRTHEERLWLELIPNAGIDGSLTQLVDGQWKWFLPEGRKTGDKPIKPLNYLTFEIDAQNTARVAYIKLNTSLIYLFRANTHTEEELLWQTLKTNLFNGFILGFLFLAMLYSLIIGVSAGERVFLYYAFYVLCNALYIIFISGYLRIVFPESATQGNIANIGALLLSFAALSFVREFLTTETSIPKTDNVLKFVQVSIFFSLIFATFLSDFQAFVITEFFGVAGPVLVMFAAFSALKAGNPYAKYFLFTWGIFVAAIFVWASMWLGIFRPTPIILELFKLGTLIEISLLSLVLGYRYSLLKTQTEQLSKAKSKFEVLSETDELTGILNRRGFLKHATQLMSDRTRQYAWLALDIDHFKKFNDENGHIAGDELLAQFGNILNTNRRREDLAAKLISNVNGSSYRRGLVGRIGGEEFALLLVDCNLPQARLYAERLLNDFKQLKVSNRNREFVGTTISIGATVIRSTDSIESIWQRADNLLYEAKEKNRDQVVIEEEGLGRE